MMKDIRTQKLWTNNFYTQFLLIFAMVDAIFHWKQICQLIAVLGDKKSEHLLNQYDQEGKINDEKWNLMAMYPKVVELF